MTVELFEGYVSFGGNEVINNERVRALLESANCVIPILRDDDCGTLAEAIDPSGTSSLGSISEAPWYDLDLPDVSGRFFGAYAIDVLQMQDSTRTVPVAESIFNGGKIGRMRLATKEVRARVLLLARGSDAMEYGRVWLDTVLSPEACGQHGETCGTTDFQFFAACPPARGTVIEYGDWVEVRRNYAPNPRAVTMDGWGVTVGAPAAMDGSLITDANAPGGIQTAFRGTLTANGSSWWRVENYPPFAATPGETITVSAYIRTLGVLGGDTHLLVLWEGSGGQVSGSNIEVLDQWGRSSVTAVVPPGATGFRVHFENTDNSAANAPLGGPVAPSIDVTGLMVERSSELDPYFDGDTVPEVGQYDVQQYSWTGAANASPSIYEQRSAIPVPEPDDAFQMRVDELVRYLHAAAVTSGPTTTDELVFEAHDLVGTIVEFTVVSERAWVYGRERHVNLPTTDSTVVQDIPYNLVTYPSAEIVGESGIIARNLSTNPSVETNATDWAAGAAVVSGTAPTAYLTSGQSADIAAVGTQSFRSRILGNGSTTVAASVATVSNYQSVSLSAVYPNGRVSINMWAGAVINAGTTVSEIQNVEVVADWLNSVGTVIGSVVIGTAANASERNGRAYSAKSLKPPVGATSVRVSARYTVQWGSSATSANNSDIRMYADALAVTVP